MRARTLLILVLLGCGQAPAPETVDVDAAYKRVVNPVPPPPDESALGSAVESYLDAAAADADSPRVKVTMLTATWCGPCKSAKAKIVPWLEEKGYAVELVDVGDGHDLQDGYGVSALPAFVFTQGDKSTAVVGPRYDTKGNVYAPDFAKALKDFPPPDNRAVSSFGVPTVVASEMVQQFAAGVEQDLWGVVHVSVPKNVSWTVSYKPASVVLDFKEGCRPSAKSLKRLLPANPDVLSVELSPRFVEIKTNSLWPMLRCIRVDLDWSPPTAVKKAQFIRSRSPVYQQRYQYRPVQQVAKPEVAPIKVTESGPLQINPNGVVNHLRNAWLASVSLTLLKEFNGKPDEGYGSGFVFRSDGYVVTNSHVVKDALSLKVVFANGQERRAKVVGSDAAADVAVVKVDETGLTTMPMSTTPPTIGQEAYTLGNPFGFNSTLCRGIISSVGRTVEFGENESVSGFIQTDAGLSPGNSGGALLDSHGRAIGVCAANHSGSVKIGFAIPIAKVMDAANRLVKP